CSCHVCALVSRPLQTSGPSHCSRCGSALHFRKPASVARSWAFLIAAYILYLPANLMPIMHTGSLTSYRVDTILSGVVYLWETGSWTTDEALSSGGSGRSLVDAGHLRGNASGRSCTAEVPCHCQGRTRRGGLWCRCGTHDAGCNIFRSPSDLGPAKERETIMSNMNPQPEFSDIPDAVALPKRRRSLQLVWIIPILAAIIGASLAVKSYLQRGPVITITFKTGEGLEPGKTKIKYKDVEIGLVKEIAIAKDRSHVIVSAELTRESKGLLVEDTRFWVVRARISGGSISGLGTLLGGSYIGVDAGISKTKTPQLAFKGLERPPTVTMDRPGRQFVLHAANIGSLDI